MSSLSNLPILLAVAVIFSLYVIRGIYNVIRCRKFMRGKPGAPHHPILGHLKVFGEVTSNLPKRIHPHVFSYYIKEKHNLPPVFYIDLMPVGPPMLAIIDPDAAAEVTGINGLQKHKGVTEWLDRFLGPKNLISIKGNVWKKWRTVFSPGFATSHLMSQVPLLVELTETFVKNLDKHASKGNVFRMEQEATRIAIDVVGKLACDFDFNTLSAENEYLNWMRATLSWMPDTQSFNPFHIFNPLRPIMIRYYRYRMERYIGRILDNRLSGQRTESETHTTRQRSSIELALEAYYKESNQSESPSKATLDPEFRKYAIAQLQALVFAGHDTTASTICYIYYFLALNPSTLLKLRQELDSVFGSNESAGPQLTSNPHLINKCEYLVATVKETLRLWTPGSTIRQGRKDFFVKEPDSGILYPTEGMMVWVVAIAMHRDARYWPDPHTFKPERFMPDNADKIVPNAYRPFEKGPRNCIGQELAMLEMKVLIAMTAREFDFSEAFDELDMLKGDGTLWNKDSSFKKGPQECFGDRAYQVLLAAAKPREGMPMRIKRR